MKAIGVLLGTLLGTGWLLGLLLYGCIPLMLLSITLSLRGIRRELERMNDHATTRAFIDAPPREYTKMGTLVTR